MARVPQSKPSVPPRAGSIPFQRGTGSGEAFGAGEARTEEERVRAGIRISEALKAASARVGQQQISAAQRTGAARTQAVENIGRARAGAVTRVGAARVGSTQRTGAANVRATAGVGAAESAAAREAEAITGEAISGVGRALSGVSEDIAAASARITLRREAVERIDMVSADTAEMKAVFEQEQIQGTNFGTEASIQQFNSSIDSIISETVAGAGGMSTEGQLILLGDLSRLSAKFKDDGVTAGVQTLHAEESRQFGEFIGEQITIVGDNPKSIQNSRQEIDLRLQQMEGTNTPEEIAGKRTAAFTAVAQAKFDNHMALGAYDEARSGLRFFPSDAPEKITATNRIVAANQQRRNINTASQAKRRQIEADLGRPMTETELLRFHEITPTVPASKTLLEQKDDAELALQRPLSDDETAKLFGILVVDKDGNTKSPSEQREALEKALDRKITDPEAAQLFGIATEQGLQAQREEIETTLGRPLTDREALSLLDITPPEVEETPAERRLSIEQALQRRLTDDEAKELFGVTSIAEQTPEQQRAAVEAALERPLSDAEATRMFDVDSPVVEPFTDIGKINDDFAKDRITADQHARLIEQAFADNPELSDERGIRQEFTKASGNFVLVADAIDRIRISARDETGEGDMSLLFAYITMLDPGSTVREGEVSTAQKTANVPDRLLLLYDKAVGGDFLTPAQRANFARLGELIFERTVEKQLGVVDAYSAVARNSGIEVNRIILTNLVPSRKGFEVNDALRDLPDNQRKEVKAIYDRAIIRGIDDFTLEDLDLLEAHPVLWNDVNERLSRAKLRAEEATARE